MPDNSSLWAWQQIYEPVPGFDGTWIVNYKDFDGEWKQHSAPDRGQAYDWYYQKYRAYQTYYNVFLRELGIKR